MGYLSLFPTLPIGNQIQLTINLKQKRLIGCQWIVIKEVMPVELIVIVLIQSFYCKNIQIISMSKKQSGKPVPEPPKKASSGFDPKPFAINGVSEEEVNAIKQAFDLFDTDAGGSVDIKELKAAMTSLGFQTKSQAIFQMLSDLDADGNGSIDFKEWYTLMTKRVSDKDSKENINKIFLLFDDERTGFINVANLRRIADSLGEHVSEEELHELVARADTDHDGHVSFEEFYTIITRKVKD